jgi:hypothetical protein
VGATSLGVVGIAAKSAIAHSGSPERQTVRVQGEKHRDKFAKKRGVSCMNKKGALDSASAPFC